MARKKTVRVVSTYSWQKTAWKFIKQFLLIGVLAALLWATEQGIPDIIIEYPHYAAILSLVSAVIVALHNYIKHYKDTEEVEI